MSAPLNSAIATLAAQAAAQWRLPESLLLAIIQVESGGDPYAWNPEPHYRYLWNVARRTPFRPLTQAERSSDVPPADFPSAAGDRDAEWWGQQASWGLVQVMGSVAREYGFHGHFPRLCDPFTGLHAGCAHLAMLVARHRASHGLRGAVAAYNAGSPRYVDGTKVFVNQSYVDKVARAGGFREGA